jgi:hypothetical protein
VGDGNLVLIEALAVDRSDGVVDRVEVSFDSQEHWMLAERSAEDPHVWRYVWDSPETGLHEVRARAFGLENRPPVQSRVAFRMSEMWTTPFTIDHSYARSGSFRKGQLHTHSTFSFDGWESLHPVSLALDYRRRGYQFVAITDHDAIANPKEANDDAFRVIPAYESTSESGHITALFAQEVVSVDLTPQQRIEQMRADGGMAILNHPSWQVGWMGTDFSTLEGCFAFEIFNYATATANRLTRNVELWHSVLNAKRLNSRIWAVAVDDAHTPDGIDHGWIMLKSPVLSDDAIRQSLESGSFYASNGPSFSLLSVMNGAITASSPDASTIRFIDHNNHIIHEGPGFWAAYSPNGSEPWIRVEAVMKDERRAWSQPFWIHQNAAATAGSADQPRDLSTENVLSRMIAPFFSTGSVDSSVPSRRQKADRPRF